MLERKPLFWVTKRQSKFLNYFSQEPYGRQVFARKKRKKNRARKVGKAQSQSAAAESHSERTTISLRLCAFARKKINFPVHRGGREITAIPSRLPPVGRFHWE